MNRLPCAIGDRACVFSTDPPMMNGHASRILVKKRKKKRKDNDLQTIGQSRGAKCCTNASPLIAETVLFVFGTTLRALGVSVCVCVCVTVLRL